MRSWDSVQPNPGCGSPGTSNDVIWALIPYESQISDFWWELLPLSHSKSQECLGVWFEITYSSATDFCRAEAKCCVSKDPSSAMYPFWGPSLGAWALGGCSSAFWRMLINVSMPRSGRDSTVMALWCSHRMFRKTSSLVTMHLRPNGKWLGKGCDKCHLAARLDSASWLCKLWAFNRILFSKPPSSNMSVSPLFCCYLVFFFFQQIDKTFYNSILRKKYIRSRLIRVRYVRLWNMHAAEVKWNVHPAWWDLIQ